MRTLYLFLLAMTLCAADSSRQNIVVNPATDLAVPQVVEGDSWKTSFFLTNLDPSKTIHWQVRFFSDGGLPMNLPIEGVGPASRLFAALPPETSVTFETPGGSSPLMQGWAIVSTHDRSADQPGAQVTTDRIGGMAIFRQRIAGRPDFEAVVPLSPVNETRFVMPFDNRANFSTGVALLNPDPSSVATVEVTMRLPDSLLIWQESFTLGPGSKVVFSMPQRFPATIGRNGRMLVTTSGRMLSGLGLRFNPGGAFTSSHALSVSP